MVQMMVHNNSFDLNTWLEAMNFQHQVCPAWGVKDPWILFLQPYWHLLQPGLVVYCERNIDKTVNSWLKVWATTSGNQGKQPPQEVVDHYAKLTIDRQRLCQESMNVWKNSITINFDTPQEEYKILERTNAKLPEWVTAAIQQASSQ